MRMAPAGVTRGDEGRVDAMMGKRHEADMLHQAPLRRFNVSHLRIRCTTGWLQFNVDYRDYLMVSYEVTQ